MTAIILAGGKSSRMGFDKAFIEIEGLPVVKRQLSKLRKIFKKIIVVTNNPDKYKFKAVKVVPDIIAGCGPLAGIYSGLAASVSFYNFIIACDMPFINERLIRYIIKNKNGYDVVVPRINGKFHPLFGIYSKNCIPVIEKRLKQKKLRVSGIFSKVKTNFIPESEIKKIDKDLLSLVNLNTKTDYRIYKGKK